MAMQVTRTSVMTEIERGQEHRRNTTFGETGDPKAMAFSGDQYLKPDALEALTGILGRPVTRVRVILEPIG